MKATNILEECSLMIYTPRRSRPNPKLPAWRREFWEKVRIVRLKMEARRRSLSEPPMRDDFSSD